MVAAEVAAHMTIRFFEAHRTMREFYGDRFAERIRPVCEALRRAADAHGDTVISEALRLMRDRAQFGAVARMHLMAAAIELMKPAELTAGEDGEEITPLL